MILPVFFNSNSGVALMAGKSEVWKSANIICQNFHISTGLLPSSFQPCSVRTAQDKQHAAAMGFPFFLGTLRSL